MRCALGCQESGASLHRIPNPDKFPEQFKAWVSVMGGKLEGPEDHLQYKNKRICGIHFKMQDMNRNNRLSCLAVPSLHLPMWCNVLDMATTSSVAPLNVKATMEKEIVDPLLDHHCTKKMKSVEHSYAMPATRELSKWKREIHSEIIPCKRYKKVSLTIHDPTKAAKSLSNEDKNNEIQSRNNEIIVEDNFYTMDQNNFADDFDDAIVLSPEDKSSKLDEDVEFLDELPSKKDPDTMTHSDFKCNVCCGDIIGFRYTCLQCVDWDMCASCEARGEHPEHYVLRLPAPRPHAECESIIAAIRQQIENLLQLSKEIKSEIYLKEEPDDAGISEEFDPYLTDPFSATSDRNVPELDMHCLQRATHVTITDPEQERPTDASACRVDEPSSLTPGTQGVPKPWRMPETPGKRVYIKSISSATDSVKESQRSDTAKIRIIKFKLQKVGINRT